MIINNEGDKEKAQRKIKALSIDKPWTMEIRPYKKNRTLAQNSLLWLWMEFIAKELGYDNPEDVYEELGDKFLPVVEYRGFDGTMKQKRIGSSKLKTKEFTEFLEKIDRFCVNFFGIILPVPEDIYYEAMGIKR